MPKNLLTKTYLATTSTKLVAVSKSRGSTDLSFSAIVAWFIAVLRFSANLFTFFLSSSWMGWPLFTVWFSVLRRYWICVAAKLVKLIQDIAKALVASAHLNPDHPHSN